MTGINSRRPKKFRQLDNVLIKSFDKVREDVLQLKENNHQQGSKITEVVQAFEDAKTDLVTLDKFNILKIKLAELNESINKFWDVEKKIDDIDRKSVDSAEFDEHSALAANEFAKLKEDIREINHSMTTESQTKALVNDINSEFDKVKNALDEIRSIKDTLTREELDRKAGALGKKANELKKDITNLKKELDKKVYTVQVEALVEDINEEFDKTKELIKQVQEGESRFVLNDDFKKQVVDFEMKAHDLSKKTTDAVDALARNIESTLNDVMDETDKRQDALEKKTGKDIEKALNSNENFRTKISKHLDKLRTDIKSMITRTQVETLVDDINEEFDAARDDLDNTVKELSTLKKSALTKKDFNRTVADLKRKIDDLGKDFTLLKKKSAMKADIASMSDQIMEEIEETEEEVENALEDIKQSLKEETEQVNRNIKQNSQDISALEKSFKKELAGFIPGDTLDEELNMIEDEFDNLKTQIKDLRKNTVDSSELVDVNKRLENQEKTFRQEFVNKKQFDSLMNVVETLQKQAAAQRSDLKDKKHEIKVYAKELKAAKKAVKKAGADEVLTETRWIKNTPVTDVVPYRKTKILSKLLIGGAFAMLIAAIILFFIGFMQLTDKLAIASVIAFVIGMIFRVVIAYKEE